MDTINLNLPKPFWLTNKLVANFIRLIQDFKGLNKSALGITLADLKIVNPHSLKFLSVRNGRTGILNSDFQIAIFMACNYYVMQWGLFYLTYLFNPKPVGWLFFRSGRKNIQIAESFRYEYSDEDF